MFGFNRTDVAAIMVFFGGSVVCAFCFKRLKSLLEEK